MQLLPWASQWCVPLYPFLVQFKPLLLLQDHETGSMSEDVAWDTSKHPAKGAIHFYFPPPAISTAQKIHPEEDIYTGLCFTNFIYRISHFFSFARIIGNCSRSSFLSFFFNGIARSFSVPLEEAV